MELGLESLERAHYLRPDDPDLLCRYGAGLLAAERLSDARLRLEAGLHLAPGHRRCTELLARLPANPEVLEQAPVPQGRRPAPAAEPPLPPVEWEPEPRPDFAELARGVVSLWLQQPLLWWLPLAAANGLVALVLLPFGVSARVDLLAGELAALALALPVLLALMVRQMERAPLLVRGGPFPGRAWRRGVALSAPYVLLFIAPVAVTLGFRTSLAAEVALQAALLLTAPFHALIGPALVISAGRGPFGFKALQRALQLSGRRTWLHLGVLVAVAGPLGIVLAGLGWTFAAVPGAAVEGILRLLHLVVLSLVESAWAAAIAVCGLDAVSAPSDAGKRPLDS